jgi:hypothetical protein
MMPAMLQPDSGIGFKEHAWDWGSAMTKLAIDVVLFFSGLPFIAALVIVAANALR